MSLFNINISQVTCWLNCLNLDSQFPPFPLVNFWVEMKFQKQFQVSLNTLLLCAPPGASPGVDVSRWVIPSAFQNKPRASVCPGC